MPYLPDIYDPDDDCTLRHASLGVEKAHELMRRHRHSTGSRCLARRAALATLILAGHYQPTHSYALL